MDEREKAAAELRRKRGTEVVLHALGGFVKYHDTRIVDFDRQMIRLDTGGWKTVTTKRRLNQVSEAFGLGFRVYQEDYRWYVDYNGKTHQFFRESFNMRRAT